MGYRMSMRYRYGYRYGIWDIDMGDDNVDTVIFDIDMGYLVTCLAPPHSFTLSGGGVVTE